MPENPSPTVAPYLLYEDATAALEWLINAFGAEERMRIPDATGAVTHAEVMIGEGQIMLGSPGGDYQSPAHSGHVHVQVYAYVDDVDSTSSEPARPAPPSWRSPATSSTATDVTASPTWRGTTGTSPPTYAMSRRRRCRPARPPATDPA